MLPDGLLLLLLFGIPILAMGLIALLACRGTERAADQDGQNVAPTEQDQFQDDR